MDSKLDAKRRDFLITTLTTGQLHFRVNSYPYFLSCINSSVKVIANTIYEESLYNNRFEGWLSNQTAKQILIQRGIISPVIDNQIKAIEESIEDMKVSLYRSMFSTSDEKRIRKELKMAKDKLAGLEKSKSELYYLTLEGFATRLKFMTLIAGSLYSAITFKRIFTNEEIKEPDFFFIDQITNKRSIIEPIDKEIREISRTQPWRTMWSLGKPNPFNKSVINLTDYQQTLMVYSNMYDNIRESIECPPDNIINDDDCCDGWLILQSRKRDKELKERQTNEVLGKKANNAQELFIPAKGKDDFDRINSMNDGGTKIVMGQRTNQIKQQGVVKDGDLFDNKVKKQGITIQQFKDKAGGK